MKKFVLIAFLAAASLSAQAGGYRYHSGHHWGHHNRWHHGTSVSFSFGYPHHSWYYPRYSVVHYPSYYSYYPSYRYVYPTYAQPAYTYYDTYTRPNYAVSGTLLGALTGGLIGHAADRKGWEGAGIGAAAGLLIGSVAERNARAYERAGTVAPQVSYAPNYIADAPTVNDAPRAPAAPQVKAPTPVYRSTSSMSSANALFGR